ncbi:MAG: bifunctional folylpolyglutamate synthase/dihydrofolate synthase [Burkholderiales bacterium]|nr:bifunctional folylpolyglutamate synthase/dihydrofolate synthase [Burkholderiales bacterium]
MLANSIFEVLNNPGNVKVTPGIIRIQEVLTLLGNPQNKYKVIHITGSNGKGSTAAFIETGLYYAGYRVGKFSSPHIKTINECICLNQQSITDNDLEIHFLQVKQIVDKHNIILSPFELLTAIMFNYFANNNIDYLVLEVGMGGQDDATNVYPDTSSNVLISIITNISLEHTAFLGKTLADISKAKAGIIKKGLTIVADNMPELIDAVENKTQNYINVLDYYNFTVHLDYDKFHTIVEINNPNTKDKEIYTLNLFGKFQAYNFLIAYHTLNYLKIPVQSIIYAAGNTHNPGRLEVKEHNPLLILDTSHNLAGIKTLIDTLEKRFDPDEVVIITSILADKDITNMLKELSTIASNVICTTIVNNSRCLPIDELTQIAHRYFKNIKAIAIPDEALKIARNMNKKLILVTGSIYLLSYFYIN